MSNAEHHDARLPRDGIANTLLVAVGVSLVCSVLVTASVTLLRPIQQHNQFIYQHRVGVLEAAGVYDPGVDIDAAFDAIEQRAVLLGTGEYSSEVSVEGFDPIASANDPETGIAVPEDEDSADIKRRAKHAVVSLVYKDGSLDQVVLPVYGAGMWSTIRGYLAVSADGSTVRGLHFYEHGETPGIGDQIEDPEWLALWPGKLIFDDDGDPALGVARRRIRERDIPYVVDAISGATITARGVTNLLRYWVGPHGFGPYLQRLQDEEASRG